MSFNRNQVEFLIQNEILSGLTWEFPARGVFTAENPPPVDLIQGQIDQFTNRIPFRPLSSANLQVPRMLYSNTDLFIDGITPNYEMLESDLSLVQSSVPDPSGPNLTSYGMRSVAAKFELPSSALGVFAREQYIQEFLEAFSQTLERFLAVATIYGQYAQNSWRYYKTAALPGWNQELTFLGLQEMCGVPAVSPGTWAENGYSFLLGAPITLYDVDTFLTLFKGSNNGHIDYLVMNSELRIAYLTLWRNINQAPQYVKDPLTGRSCLAHDGIPILIDDYIINYDPDVGAYDYLQSTDNPEYFSVSEGFKQTSMYAINLGEENKGIFGIYPESFGSSPLKVEHSEPSQTQDTILLRGMIEAGLVPKTRMSVARMASIRL